MTAAGSWGRIFMAWKRGVKSLYYCRSLSIQRADNVSSKAIAPVDDIHPANDTAAPLPLVAAAASTTDYEECLACQ